MNKFFILNLYHIFFSSRFLKKNLIYVCIYIYMYEYASNTYLFLNLFYKILLLHFYTLLFRRTHFRFHVTQDTILPSNHMRQQLSNNRCMIYIHPVQLPTILYLVTDLQRDNHVKKFSVVGFQLGLSYLGISLWSVQYIYGPLGPKTLDTQNFDFIKSFTKRLGINLDYVRNFYFFLI